MISIFLNRFLTLFSRPDPKEAVVNFLYIKLVVIAQHLLETCNPLTHLGKRNFWILFFLVLPRSSGICLALLEPSPYPAFGCLEPSLQAIFYGWPR